MRRNGNKRPKMFSRGSRSKTGRHRSHCRICRHPRREEIEQEFLDWTSLREIGSRYKISKTAVYRHAEAVGLFQQRRKKMGMALGRIVERVSDVRVDATAVISAIRLTMELNIEDEVAKARGLDPI